MNQFNYKFSDPGAIFDDGTFLMEAAFNVAVTAASEGLENPFVPEVVRSSPGDSIEAQQAMCGLLEVPICINLLKISAIHNFIKVY